METDSPPSPPPPSAHQNDVVMETDSPPPPPIKEREKEMVHRTKVIQFLGRTTPIILQNDNGPCPLLAICNVLSLKNSLNLSPDVPEVSQEKLLSLVAGRLIDSNSNTDNKDRGYVENQQQNIADAIDLLPRLATGIDVNVKFRRIDDFEFTPECAIFDLLDIPLYHGWIVDPQDHETADAIGSKSYNTLMGELVSLETQTIETELKKNPEDDSVDFVAATTAALGVPSPCLSRGQSFDESPRGARKGDVEEEAELMRAIKMSEEQSTTSTADDVAADLNLHEGAYMKKSELLVHSELVENSATNEAIETTTLILDDSDALTDPHSDVKVNVVVPHISDSSISKSDQENIFIQPTCEESRKHGETGVEKTFSDAQIANENNLPASVGQSGSDSTQDKLGTDEHSQNEVATTAEADEPRTKENKCKDGDSSRSLDTAAVPHSSNGRMDKSDEPEGFTSCVNDGEPIYEGEECILDSRTVNYENREPVYEGEVILAEQVDRDCTDNGDFNITEGISIKQGELIRNFMRINASQLTIYGLFCLQDKVKERELCVFFRNNHFSTMFKYEGELYILVTDQGYMNQPDLVWEKLNEVNGDTVYMTGSFKEFKMDDHSNSTTWNEQNAVATTADYLAAIDNTTHDDSSFNSDLQLAIALQQQEFEQQQQQQQPQRRNMQQPAIGGNSGLITGPQVSRPSGKYTSSSSKQESKSKEKCIIM